MKLHQHIILSSVASVALWPALHENVVVFLFSSVLIDFDHYIDFIYRNGLKCLNVKKMFEYYNLLVEYCKNKKEKYVFISLFHTGEFLLLWLAISVWLGSSFTFVVFLGMIFHIFCDFLNSLYRGNVFGRAYFLTEYLIRRKIGDTSFNTDDIYRSLLRLMRSDAKEKLLCRPSEVLTKVQYLGACSEKERAKRASFNISPACCEEPLFYKISDDVVESCY